ncbi:MAG: radical SAM protein [Candidatus Omnitrophota bacterium]
MIPFRNLKRVMIKSIMQPGYALKVFAKRLAAFVSYSIFDGSSTLPEAVTLFLTHRCNLRCKMCGQWGDVGASKKAETALIREELPLSVYEKLIREIAPFRPNITLFGGEPLLYSGCVDLIRRVKAKKMHCCMITNATLLPRYAGEIVATGLDELNISLDGPEAKHDEIRGIPGMYQQIREGVESVQRAKKMRGSSKPFINIEFTITQYNYELMPAMIDAARSFEANSLNFHHLVFVDQAMLDAHEKVFYPLFQCSSDDWKGFLLSGVEKIDTKKLSACIADVKSRRAEFLINVYPNLTPGETAEYYADPARIPAGYARRCLSPWMVAYVFPDGNIRPCLNFSYSPGNVRDDSFTGVWNNAEYKKFRSALKKRGVFPACSRCTELYRY